MEPNDLYELVADYGEFYGMALRRDSHLLRGVDLTENWLDIVEIIREERAQDLSEGKTVPNHIELSYLTRWQAAQALQTENDAIVCGIWLCQPDADDVVFAIEGWGRSINTELKFVLIGQFPNEIEAIDGVRKLYIFDVDDL